jgi:hypothetical protein
MLARYMDFTLISFLSSLHIKKSRPVLEELNYQRGNPKGPMKVKAGLIISASFLLSNNKHHAKNHNRKSTLWQEILTSKI